MRPGFAALFMRSLLASDQGTAVARVAAAVVGLARESRRNETADADAALKAVCTLVERFDIEFFSDLSAK